MLIVTQGVSLGHSNGNPWLALYAEMQLNSDKDLRSGKGENHRTRLTELVTELQPNNDGRIVEKRESEIRGSSYSHNSSPTVTES